MHSISFTSKLWPYAGNWAPFCKTMVECASFWHQANLNVLTRRWTVTKTKRFCQTVEEVYKLRHTKNGGRTSFPVGARRKLPISINWQSDEFVFISDSDVLTAVSMPYQSNVNDLWTQWYEYRKDCNWYSNDTAKKVKYHYFLPRELLIYNQLISSSTPKCSKQLLGPQSVVELRNLGALYRCINVSKTSSGKAQTLLS